ncbi:hypothetical protein ABH922_003793 [Rhodococcus sp. 27YEA15]|uniref:GIY-YIG nuclease family protein n=1 Tax=Rhodococcus sp. 27YEA15 TaxID=3156259 RepID=UPI003C7C7D20
MAIVWTVPRGIGPTLLVAPSVKEFLAADGGTLDAKLAAVSLVSASLEKLTGRTFTSISTASATIFSGAAGSSTVPDALRLAVMRTLSTEVIVRKPAPRPFSDKVAKRLGEYVFALRDPRNDQVFHVGHGSGNQVFAPVFEALGESAALEGAVGPVETDTKVTAAKISRIREIYDAGSAVEHFVVVRSTAPTGEASGTAGEIVRGIVEVLRIGESGASLTNLAGDSIDKDLRATRVEELALRYSARSGTGTADPECGSARTGVSGGRGHPGRDLRAGAPGMVGGRGGASRSRDPRSGVRGQHYSWSIPRPLVGGVDPQRRRQYAVAICRRRGRRAGRYVRRYRGHTAQCGPQEVAGQRVGHPVDHRPPGRSDAGSA